MKWEERPPPRKEQNENKEKTMATQIPAGEGFGRPVAPAGCRLLKSKNYY